MNGLIIVSLVLMVISSITHANCGDYFCDVTKFSGNTDTKVESAITAALNTRHKTVYFPDGDYELTKSITLPYSEVFIKFQGSSSSKVRLISNPIIERFSNNLECLGSVFNIDHATGFNYLDVTIQDLTIDMKRTHQHDIFLSGGCSGGHGVRIGNGWKSGRFEIKNVDIQSPAFYGIGIQNSRSNDIFADHIKIENVRIYRSGSDAIDTKSPPTGNNRFFTVNNLLVEEVGFNDESSAAALDISYDNFKLKNITIKTQPTRVNPRGTAFNTGIRIRQRPVGSSSNGSIESVHITGTGHAIFPEGKIGSLNKNIRVTKFLVEEQSGTGVYLRGENMHFSGCIDSKVSGSRAIANDTRNQTSGTITSNLFTSYTEENCGKRSEIGFQTQI